MNGLIWLKFGTLIIINSGRGRGEGRGCFSKILTFKPWGRDTRPYIDQKSLGCPKEDMNVLIWPNDLTWMVWNWHTYRFYKSLGVSFLFYEEFDFWYLRIYLYGSLVFIVNRSFLEMFFACSFDIPGNLFSAFFFGLHSSVFYSCWKNLVPHDRFFLCVVLDYRGYFFSGLVDVHIWREDSSRHPVSVPR